MIASLRIITGLIVLFILLSCKQESQVPVPEDIDVYEFTEADAYDITNILKDQLFAYDSDSIIYWYRDRVKSPPIEYTDIYSDEIPVTMRVDDTPFPRYTSQQWDMGKLPRVTVIEKEEFGYYFKENDSVDLEEQWDAKFKGNTVYHVSYPLYNSQSKVAVIQYFTFKPFLHCLTDAKKVHLFKKVDGVWEEL